MSKYHQTQLDQESTIQFQLEIRLSQLSTAADLELWQEAFRSVEDINNIIHISKKTPQPEMMVQYYEKLAKIFWVSENYVFHTLSLLKFVELTREIKKDLDPATVRVLASKVLLASLSIPFVADDEQSPEYNLEFDLQRDKNTKMAQLLGFTEVEPRREAVLAAVLQADLVKHVFPEVETVYSLMEEKFSPLHLSPALKKLVEFLAGNENLQQYQRTLVRWGSVRLLQHLSDVFSTVKLDRLHKLLPIPATASLHEVEKLVVQSLQARLIECRLDHKNNTIQFQTNSFESSSVRYRLTEAAAQLQKIQAQIRPSKLQDAQTAKKALFVKVASELDEEHRRLMQRRQDIEKIKQQREKREEEERKRQEEEEKRRQREAEEAERQRQLAKVAEREAKRVAEKEAEQKAAELKAVMEKINELAPKAVGAPVAASVVPEQKNLAQIDTATLVEEQVRKIVSEKEKMEKKLRDLAEKKDHETRAKRELETTLLKEMIQKRLQDDRTYWETQVTLYLENHRKQWEHQLVEKKRVEKMQADKKALFERLMVSRRSEHEKATKARVEKIAELKVAREAKRKADEERKIAKEAEDKAREDEARRRREEEARRRIEEEDKLAEEEEAREAARGAEGARRDVEGADDEARRREEGPAAAGGRAWGRREEPPGGWKRPGGGAAPRPAADDEEEPAGDRAWRRTPAGPGPREDREERPEAAGNWRRERPAAPAPRDDRPPREGFGGDRPPREGFGGDRPPREGFGGDRPPREGFGGDRPPREDREDGGGNWRRNDRPPREGFGGDRPPREGFGGDRPPREGFGGDRPPREGFGGDRPPREGFGGDRPPREGFGGDRPPREGGDNWRRNDRPPRDGPREDRPPRDGPREDRPPRDGPRDGADRPPREGGDNWRRNDRPPRDAPRDAPREGGRPPRDAPAPRSESSGGDDGWTKVKRGNK
jgi:translation initiation factor 3 subunit A